MIKHILLISASPRVGGNSDLLCDELAKGIVSNGNTYEKMNLAKMNIKPCLACNVCQGNEGNCVQKDDMSKIIEAYKRVDAVVFATPLYFFNINAQLKIIMDRTYCEYQYGNEYVKFSFHKTAFIATCGRDSEVSFDTAIRGYKEYIKCLHDVTDVGMVLATSVLNKGDVVESKFMKEAYELGKKL